MHCISLSTPSYHDTSVNLHVNESLPVQCSKLWDDNVWRPHVEGYVDCLQYQQTKNISINKQSIIQYQQNKEYQNQQRILIDINKEY